jgi:hypothetical protein
LQIIVTLFAVFVFFYLIKFKIVLSLFAAILIGFFLFSFLLMRKPKYKGLSLPQIQKYVAYASEALSGGGQLEIEPKGFRSPIRLEKKVHKSKEDSIIISMRSGFNSRGNISAASEALNREGIEHRLIYTRKRNLPRRLYVSLPAENKFGSSAATHIIRILCEAIGAGDSPSFSITCWGPYNNGYTIADGEIIEKPISFRVGHFIGYIGGALYRLFDFKKNKGT